MEVHAHTHTPRKKWTHYVWEFLMLFLAVFCGFLAEYKLEHIIEHQREKQYLQSLLSDIREDTSTVNNSRMAAMKALAYDDSVLLYLYKNPPKDFLPQHFLDLDGTALQRLKIVFNEVTAQQLKNSGNMRLIRKAKVSKCISLYWNEQENTKINLGRYLEYRNRGREFTEKLYSFSDDDLIKAKLIDSAAKGIRVIQSNPALWSEYSNIISHCRTTVSGYLDQLEKLSQKATELIDLLQNEYHLE